MTEASGIFERWDRVRGTSGLERIEEENNAFVLSVLRTLKVLDVFRLPALLASAPEWP